MTERDIVVTTDTMVAGVHFIGDERPDSVTDGDGLVVDHPVVPKADPAQLSGPERRDQEIAPPPMESPALRTSSMRANPREPIFCGWYPSAR